MTTAWNWIGGGFGYLAAATSLGCLQFGKLTAAESARRHGWLALAQGQVGMAKLAELSARRRQRWTWPTRVFVRGRVEPIPIDNLPEDEHPTLHVKIVYDGSLAPHEVAEEVHIGVEQWAEQVRDAALA